MTYGNIGFLSCFCTGSYANTEFVCTYVLPGLTQIKVYTSRSILISIYIICASQLDMGSTDESQAKMFTCTSIVVILNQLAIGGETFLFLVNLN